MSDLHATIFDWPVVPSKSDTVDEPYAFAAVLALADGNAIVWPVGGPHAGSGLTIAVVKGELLPFPIRRIGASSSDVLGLVGSIVR